MKALEIFCQHEVSWDGVCCARFKAHRSRLAAMLHSFRSSEHDIEELADREGIQRRRLKNVRYRVMCGRRSFAVSRCSEECHGFLSWKTQHTTDREEHSGELRHSKKKRIKWRTRMRTAAQDNPTTTSHQDADDQPESPTPIKCSRKKHGQHPAACSAATDADRPRRTLEYNRYILKCRHQG